MKAANLSLGVIAGLVILANTAVADSASDADRWRIHGSVSFVYLDRDDPPDSLVIQDAITGDSVLRGSDFNPDWSSGVDARLGLGYSEWGIEGRFFGEFGWSDSANPATPAIFNFTTTPPLFGLGAAELDAEHTSKLTSAEANLLWSPLERVTVFGGARWLDLTDRLVADLDFGANAATIRFDNRASGFGPQIGARVRVLDFADAAVPLFLDIEGTVGAVRLKHRADFEVTQEIGPSFESDGDDRDWTFLGEFGANLGLAVTENVEIAVGYRLIYVDEVPSSVRQPPGVDIIAGTSDPETESLFAHGVNLGLTVRF